MGSILRDYFLVCFARAVASRASIGRRKLLFLRVLQDGEGEKCWFRLHTFKTLAPSSFFRVPNAREIFRG
jgi:hypothetical protein